MGRRSGSRADDRMKTTKVRVWLDTALVLGVSYIQACFPAPFVNPVTSLKWCDVHAPVSGRIPYWNLPRERGMAMATEVYSIENVRYRIPYGLVSPSPASFT